MFDAPAPAWFSRFSRSFAVGAQMRDAGYVDGTHAQLYGAGLVIHEARFTYPSYGLKCVQDLGEWWEADTGLPVPLGAIIARRSLDTNAIAETIRASVEQAWKDPAASRDYVMAHAAEMDPAVADQHIALYVNEFTRDLGEEGNGAARILLDRAAAAGLTPEWVT